MLVLIWAICVYFGVRVTAKSLARQEQDPRALNK
jgi:hypothetical protein